MNYYSIENSMVLLEPYIPPATIDVVDPEEFHFLEAQGMSVDDLMDYLGNDVAPVYERMSETGRVEFLKALHDAYVAAQMEASE